MQKPLISVLMPMKNASAYLQDCIDSIIHQSYENWELLVVNDHSTDDSEKIIKKILH